MEKLNFAKWIFKNENKNNFNIFAPPLDAQLAIHFLIRYLLGEDWYINYPGNQLQVNSEAVDAILKKYSKNYKKEIKKLRKDIQNGKISTRAI